MTTGSVGLHGHVDTAVSPLEMSLMRRVMLIMCSDTVFVRSRDRVD